MCPFLVGNLKKGTIKGVPAEKPIFFRPPTVDGLSQTDKECFINPMQAEVRLALTCVIEAVNAAPDGPWISVSGRPVLEEIDELKRKSSQAASFRHPARSSLVGGDVAVGYDLGIPWHKLLGNFGLTPRWSEKLVENILFYARVLAPAFR